MVMILLELCTTYSSSSPVVTTTSIILCFNKHWLTQVHLELGRWPLKRRERAWIWSNNYCHSPYTVSASSESYWWVYCDCDCQAIVFIVRVILLLTACSIRLWKLFYCPIQKYCRAVLCSPAITNATSSWGWVRFYDYMHTYNTNATKLFRDIQKIIIVHKSLKLDFLGNCRSQAEESIPTKQWRTVQQCRLVYWVARKTQVTLCFSMSILWRWA